MDVAPNVSPIRNIRTPTTVEIANQDGVMPAASRTW